MKGLNFAEGPAGNGKWPRTGLVVGAAILASSLSGISISGPAETSPKGGLVASHRPLSLAGSQNESSLETSPPNLELAGPAPRKEVAPRLLTARLVPPEVTLWGAGASQRFVVLAKFADGLERDVTGKSLFWISNPRLARTDESGRVQALADGQTILTAEIAGHRGQAKLRIEGSQEDERPISFSRDIAGILTKHGCNGSECHGGVKGKGGFKLSLNALYPREDYEWIVQGGIYQVLSPESGGPRKPRIDLQEPENSLLSLKPTFSVPHEGGLRFPVDSSDHRTLLQWIDNGAPYGDEEVRVERLEVFPGDTVLEPEGKHQLVVSAYLSNGRREDATDQVRYVSNNPEVVRAGPGGLVQAVATGEAAVMITVAGLATSIRVGVTDHPIVDYPDLPRNNLIDDHVFAKLRRFHIIPSPLSSHAEFLRRVCLDLTGTLPPPRRVREFLASHDPQKREKLIDILLNSPEYVQFWTFRFADLLRAGVGGYKPEVLMSWAWVRRSIAENKAYDQMARERIAAQGYDGPSRHFVRSGEKGRFEKVMAEQVRVFLGRRLDCAQCHNHPYDNWSQDQFWGLAAFFSRRTDTLWNAGQVIFDDPEGQEINYGEEGRQEIAFIKAIHPRTRREFPPTFPDGTLLPDEKRADPRLALAEWLTSHPYFAEAIVNRMWGYFFGRGIVDPVDDFGLHNPPTHPELLSGLARDFREHGYDWKYLIRLIVSSRTYQLASIPNKTNQDDQLNFARSRPRRLEAEVLLDAISAATGVPEIFEQAAGQRASRGSRAIDLTLPARYLSRFLEIYGRPLRDTVPERDHSSNLAQALHMLVGPTYAEKLAQKGGRVDRLLESGASNREMIEELYLASLGRFPTRREQPALEAMIAERASRREAMEDLVWSLISSREFGYNH